MTKYDDKQHDNIKINVILFNTEWECHNMGTWWVLCYEVPVCLCNVTVLSWLLSYVVHILNPIWIKQPNI